MSALEELYSGKINPIQWISSKLLEFQMDDSVRVLSAPQLERELQQLHSSIEVGVEELSAATEQGEDKLAQVLHRMKTEAEAVSLEISACRRQLSLLTSRLSEVGADQLTSLSVLSEADSLKRRLATCRKILSELNQWDIRVKELELLLKTLTSDAALATSTDECPAGISGSLYQAVTHLVSMKETVHALGSLPRLEGKNRWVNNFEGRLLDACGRRLKRLVKMKSVTDCVQCAQVFHRLGCDDQFTRILIASMSEVFVSEFDSKWNETKYSKHIMSVDSSPSIDDRPLLSEDEAVLSYFKSSGHILDSTISLIQSCCAIQTGSQEIQGNKLFINVIEEIVICILRLPIPDINQFASNHAEDESHVTSLMSVLTSLEVGYNVIASIPIINEIEEHYHSNNAIKFIDQIGRNATAFPLFPLQLSTAIVHKFDMWLSSIMSDSPPLKPGWGATQTINEAEIDADRILRAVGDCFSFDSLGKASSLQQSCLSGEHLASAASAVEVLFLIDKHLVKYWKNWRPILNLFENTIKSSKKTIDEQAQKADAHKADAQKANILFPTNSLTIDPLILGPAAQLNRKLQNLLKNHLSRLAKSIWLPLFNAWNSPSRLNSVARNTIELGLDETCAQYKDIVRSFKASERSEVIEASIILPLSTNELESLYLASQSLVIFCAIFPIETVLKIIVNVQLLSTMHVVHMCVEKLLLKTLTGSNTVADGIPPPTPFATSIGEYLLAAVPHFDIDYTSTTNMLDLALQRAETLYISAVKQIPNLTAVGLLQLQSDVRYLNRALTALGTDSIEAQELGNNLNQWIERYKEQADVVIDGKMIFDVTNA